MFRGSYHNYIVPYLCPPFLFFYPSTHAHSKVCLHVNPPRHPELRNFLRLVHQAHVQEQLRGAPDGALQRAENPGVRV